MGAEPSKQKKDELIQAVQQSKEAAEQTRARAQRTVQDAHFTVQMADLAKDAVQNIPNDTFLPPAEWDQRTGFWRDTANRLKSFDGIGWEIGGTASSTAVAVSDVLFIGAYNQPLPGANKDREESIVCQFEELLEASSWDTVLEADFIRLHLDRPTPGHKSALDHFRDAKGALSTPSAGAPTPTAVLLAVRSCIDCALADLLRRCPGQARAPKAGDKVTFICGQIGKAEIDAGQIAYLAATATKLHSDLSSLGKQTDMDAAAIRWLFRRTEVFMKAFLSAIG